MGFIRERVYDCLDIWISQKMDYDTMTEPRECRMVVALADIAGFDKASRKKSGQEVFSMLDEFYELVGNIVGSAGGRVVKFMGDCAFIVFPEEKARPAVDSLHDLQGRTQTLWSEFDSTCKVSVNAHSGTVLCGLIGTTLYKRFDVFGTPVNDLFRMPLQGFGLSKELEKAVAHEE